MVCVRSPKGFCLFSVALVFLASKHAAAYLGPGVTQLEQPTPVVSAVLTEQIRQDIDRGGNGTIIQEPQDTANKEDIAAFDELDLVRAVSSAVSTHPSIRQATDMLFRSEESIRVAKAGYYPKIQGGLSTEHNNRDFDRYDERTLHRWTISASQMLYDFGEVASAVSGAEAARAAARGRVLLSIDQVARETSYAFIELQRYQALRAIAEDQVTGVAAIADLARERRVKGASTLSDELQAQSREEAARATLLDMQAQVERWRHSVLYLTGLDSLETLSTDMPDSFQLACRGDVPAWGLLPEVLVAEAEQAVAVAELEEISAQAWPTISLEVSAGRAINATPRTGSRNDASVMLNMSMPFYQGGSMQAQKRAAAHALNAAGAAGNHARLTASQGLLEAQSRERGYRQRIALLAQRINSIQMTRDLYQEQYLELGTRSLLDLLNAEQEYHQANLEKTNNEHDMRRMQVDCLYNAGQIRNALDLNGTVIAGVEVMP